MLLDRDLVQCVTGAAAYSSIPYNFFIPFCDLIKVPTAIYNRLQKPMEFCGTLQTQYRYALNLKWSVGIGL